VSGSHSFEAFVRQSYPAHYRRIRTAQSQIRLPVLKAVLESVALFGAPICGTVWGMGLLLEAQSHQLQDGQKPLPFIHYIEPAVVTIVCITLIACVLVGVWVGIQRNRRLTLQIEQDQLKLRTDYLLRQLTDRHAELTAQLYDDRLVLRVPNMGVRSTQSQSDNPGTGFPSDQDTPSAGTPPSGLQTRNAAEPPSANIL
jgi:hypothetical protein